MREIGGESKEKFKDPENSFPVVKRSVCLTICIIISDAFGLSFWHFNMKNMQTLYGLKVSKVQKKDRSNTEVI